MLKRDYTNCNTVRSVVTSVTSIVTLVTSVLSVSVMPSAAGIKQNQDQDLVSVVCHLQDANVFVCECDSGTKFDLALGAKRQAYLICIEGHLAVNNEQMTTRDAAEAVAGDEEPMQLQLEALQKGSHFMIIEMSRS